PPALNTYAVSASNKSFEFWQSDSLAIRLNPKEVAMQKRTYIHNNPTAEHGNVVKNPCEYKYSSAR
ncbi:MAG: transposase, partial [Flavisolibacter sp.]|nr:transposase [Flavisolibacter sp.]